jgi:hypothetical protein
MSNFRFLDGSLFDARFALRQLRKTPGFTITSILTLALGIGAATAMFVVIYGVLLRPLPFPDSQRLYRPVGIDALGNENGSATLFPNAHDASQVKVSIVPGRSGAHTSNVCLLISCEIYSLTENDKKLDGEPICSVSSPGFRSNLPRCTGPLLSKRGFSSVATRDLLIIRPPSSNCVPFTRIATPPSDRSASRV